MLSWPGPCLLMQSEAQPCLSSKKMFELGKKQETRYFFQS